MYPRAVAEAFQQNGVWYQDYEVQEPNGAVVVKRFMHNGTDWVPAPVEQAPQTTSFKIDLSKNIPDTQAGISLKKNVVNLDKALVNLSKSSGINLGGHSAKVAAIIDFSGSMRPLYNDGSVQRVLSRLVPLGLRFDDNGEVDVWLFHDGYRRLDGINLNNFDTYVNNVMLRSGEHFGCTSYAPVLRDAMQKYTVEEPSQYPAFIIFITDGANDDRKKTDQTIRDTSRHHIFIQFVGLNKNNNERFDYLRKLDDLDGRPVDNTGFFSVKDFDLMSDDELYGKLLEQYVDWLRSVGLQ